MLTFNRTLRGYIKQLATEQVDREDDLALTIETFGGWARSLIGQHDLLEDDGRHWVRYLLGKEGVPTDNLDYLVDEAKYVQGRFPPDRHEQYLGAVRSGRGRAPALLRELRHRLLKKVIVPYERMKSQSDKVDWNDIALRAAKVPSERYDIVVVDESQDLSANDIRAVLAHLHEDHVTTFIIDAVQRIYPQGFQWAEVGINMRPQMVFTLERNHRNSKETARLASSLVKGLPPDTDGVLPDESMCQESGVRPKVVEGTYSSQMDYMLNHVGPRLGVGETVAILHARGGGWFDCTREMLRQRSIPFCELTRKREWPTGPEMLALSTIHSAKGLEFDHVLMPGLSKELTPHGNEEGDGTLDSIRRLVAMGVGRARKTAMLGYKAGERSTVFDLIDSATYDLVKL